MSSNSKMLIDATHPEETRVVVVKNGRVEEFDYESAARKLLRGNIYLAKVTRVEPSLQAAFVDYGGNRHGFLAFNEIHPDYYQIPMADRQALIDEEAQAEAEEEAAVDAKAESWSERRSAESDDDDGNGDEPRGERQSRRRGRRDRNGRRHSQSRRIDSDDRISEPHDDSAAPVSAGEEGEPAHQGEEAAAEAEAAPAQDDHDHVHDHGSAYGAAHEATHDDERPAFDSRGGSDSDDGESGGVHEIDTGNGNGDAEAVEEVSTEQDALEEVPSRPRRRMRSYKIQEVIKRRQIVLVQVVKEERGNKGAALTTYLSLAGRYTVLMPNTARGGGISRKITNPADRKRLKAIAHELEVPEGMGLIIRTAGAARTKQEIKRDFEYLLRLWESVRDLTLQSTAPSLVYEEGNLIKRSIRDHFTKDVDEVVVAGDHAYHEAHDFMRMLMPSHARNVINYKDPEPLFARFQVERQLSAMFSPFVTLRSGGYLVINQTEALVAIDINSGKSTREFSIEETALNTNLEAAEEIARQLKLRDLAGLIVIDFIDMEEKRNNRSVERRLKDSLRFDRARIQIGRISHFGLLEMSRQRLRTGVLEGSTTQCPHCQGTGIVRSTESVALAVLRGIEDALMANPRGGVIASTTSSVAIYILNSKRAYIIEMEARYGVPITIQASDKLHGANFTVERTAAPAIAPRRPERHVVNMDWGFDGEEPVEEIEPEAEMIEPEGDIDDIVEVRDGEDEESGQDGDRRGRRRRRRRGRRGDRPEGGEQRPHHHRERESRSDRPMPPAAMARGALEGEPTADEGGDRYASYAAFAAMLADGEPSGEIRTNEGIDVVGPAAAGSDDFDDRGGRRGRRRGRRGGRRGRDRDDQRFENGNAYATASSDGIPGQGEQPDVDVPLLPGQGPQPDVTPVYPAAPGIAGGEGRPMSRRDRWRNRNDDKRGRDGWRGDRDRNNERAPVVPAAVLAATIAAASFEPAPPAPVEVEIASAPPAEPLAGTEAPVAVAVAEISPAPFDVRPEAAPAEFVPQAPAVPARPRRSLEIGEAKIERVVIGPEQSETTGEEPAPTAAPARRGWWQRRFSGSA
jgi:ribonuclease E